MKIKYFKNYSHLGDCYVGPGRNRDFDFFNIVSVGNDYLFLLANDDSSNYDDGRFDGLYRFMEVSKKDFENLKEMASNKDRKKGLTLLRKIHEENPDKNPHCASIEGSAENFNLDKTFEIYKKSKPILE